MEVAVIDVPDEFSGVVIDKLSQRKGELQNMGAGQGGYTRLEFKIPSRGLIGYLSEFRTDTRGTGIMNRVFDKYDLYRGAIQQYRPGVLVSMEKGGAATYALFN